MKKLLVVFLIFVMAAFVVTPPVFGAIALVWDGYTDPEADNLRVESSATGNSGWTQTGGDIETTRTAFGLTPGINQRIYYRVVAFNTDYDSPSNTVSFYWSTDGGGEVGLQTPGNIGFIDCDNPESQADSDICTDNGIN